MQFRANLPQSAVDFVLIYAVSLTTCLYYNAQSSNSQYIYISFE